MIARLTADLSPRAAIMLTLLFAALLAAPWLANDYLLTVLIGLTEAIAGLLFTPSAKSMFAFAILVLVLLFRPQGLLGKRLA